jgi:hypothetical protein
VVFWIMTLFCSLIGGYQHFGWRNCLHLQGRVHNTHFSIWHMKQSNVFINKSRFKAVFDCCLLWNWANYMKKSPSSESNSRSAGQKFHTFYGIQWPTSVHKSPSLVHIVACTPEE